MDSLYSMLVKPLFYFRTIFVNFTNFLFSAAVNTFCHFCCFCAQYDMEQNGICSALC